MNVRARSLTGIVPMFLILGLTTGLLVSYVNYKETYWGLSEEVSGLAVAASEFIEPGLLEELANETSTSPGKERFMTSMNRLINLAHLQRVTITREGENTAILDIGPPAKQPPAKPEQIQPETAAVVYIPHAQDIPSVMQAFIRTASDNNNRPAILMTQISAEPLTALKDGLASQLLAYLLISIAAGTACALIVSSILISSIRDLARAAEKAAGGDYNIQQERSCSIQEIKDLWNTFLTATSVLRGVVEGSRRQLLNMELLRTERDLVHALTELNPAAQFLSHGSLDWCAAPLRRDQPEVISDIIAANGTVYAIAGTIHKAATELNTAVAASSLLGYFRRNIRLQPLPSVLNHIPAVSDVASMRILTYTPQSNEIAVFTYRKESGIFTKSSIMKPSTPLLFHELKDEPGVRLDVFVQSSRQSRCVEIMEDLQNIAARHCDTMHGAILVIAPAAPENGN